jgi:uncharacterized protein YoxC
MSKANLIKATLCTHAGYLIVIVILISLFVKKGNYCEKIMDEHCEEIEHLEKQVDDLQTENNIFTSMLGEIENEPGGHEILNKLWNENR